MCVCSLPLAEGSRPVILGTITKMVTTNTATDPFFHSGKGSSHTHSVHTGICFLWLNRYSLSCSLLVIHCPVTGGRPVCATGRGISKTRYSILPIHKEIDMVKCILAVDTDIHETSRTSPVSCYVRHAIKLVSYCLSK